MKTSLSILVLAAFATSAIAQGGAAAVKTGQSGEKSVATQERKKFDPKADAAADIKAAIELAKKEKKRILLDVGGEWCWWCHKLDAMFMEPDVAKALKENFVVVKVNYSEENKNEAVLKQYPAVSGYPHLFVLESDGKLLHSQNTEELELKKPNPNDKLAHDKDKVMAFIKKWAPPKSK